jgi:hypothetical protein
VRSLMHPTREPLFSRAGTIRCAIAVSMLGLPLTVSPSAAQDERRTAATSAEPCAGNNGGITLPPRQCNGLRDNTGHARQMVVAPNGVVYVNTWSGRYYRMPWRITA